MKIGSYKLTNPKRFIAFITTVILLVVYISVIFQIKTITETKINKNLEISEKIQNSIIIEAEAEEISSEFEKVITIETKEPELKSLGSFTVTAYCCCKECCGKSENHPAYGITKSGKRATEGRTIAVDPNIIPLGTTVYLNNTPYIAEDTGSAIKGKKIDLFINDHQRAKVFGVQEMEVKI